MQQNLKPPGGKNSMSAVHVCAWFAALRGYAFVVQNHHSDQKLTREVNRGQVMQLVSNMLGFVGFRWREMSYLAVVVPCRV